jgi:hypothetical protein
MKRITPFRPSFASFMLQTHVGEKDLKQATGFVVKNAGRAYLVSNGHVFSGRNPFTGASDHTPDSVTFKYWRTENPIELSEHREPLLAESEPLWLEHPTHGRKVDVAALPLVGFGDVPLAFYDPWIPRRVELGVGDDVTVVGFPFGVNTSALAIWTRASIASEFDVDYDDLPVYLVDARTRDGQSGSPVIFFRTGAYFAKYGEIVLPDLQIVPRLPGAAIDDDQPRPRSGFTEEFLGVYSGRINVESDLGFVWRPSALREIIDRGRRATW